MTRKLSWILVAALLTLPGAGLAQNDKDSPKAPAAKSPEELLRIVEQGGRVESAENRAREERFRKMREERRRLLSEAQSVLAREERRSEALEDQFNANEQKIAQLDALLRERQGTYGEVIGIVRGAANDAAGMVEDSLVRFQIPDRAVFLRELAQSKDVPSLDKLERLWYVLQQEAYEAGRVVRFPATVTNVSGERVETQVVRVGVFNAVAGGSYLSIDDSGNLIQLARQPAGQHQDTVDDLTSARSGFVGFSLDPSRGQILKLLVDVPTFLERIRQGKAIGYIIIVLGGLGVLFAVLQWVYLAGENRKIQAQLTRNNVSPNNALGRVLSVYNANRREDPDTLELKLDEAVLKETPRLERFLNTIKVLSVVAPLLGLLGTVTGMIQTFQAITLFGAGDPKLMAGGISEALVTTMLGLMAAIPLVLLHSFVQGRSRSITQILDEQSAGLIARHAERRNAPTN